MAIASSRTATGRRNGLGQTIDATVKSNASTTRIRNGVIMESESQLRDKKVDMLLKQIPRGYRQDEISKVLRVTKCLPFYRRGPLRLVHRVREAHLFYYHGELSHLAVRFWCGNCGYIDYAKSPQRDRRRGQHASDNASLFAIAPDPAVFCATCEGRAVGAGMDGAREINGRTVLFRPRELKIHWQDEPPPARKSRIRGPGADA